MASNVSPNNSQGSEKWKGWSTSAKARVVHPFTYATRRIIVGSGGIPFDDWVRPIEKSSTFCLRTLGEYIKPASLDAVMAEHVWEHLPTDGAAVAARTCYYFLKPNCYLRVAVPDGLNPDPSYIEAVKPGGTGAGSDDHKVLYTYSSFSEVFASAGFDVNLYEYFDEQGMFHFKEWDPSQGKIMRSKRFDSRNSNGQLGYTSIVLDAVKPDHPSAAIPGVDRP